MYFGLWRLSHFPQLSHFRDFRDFRTFHFSVFHCYRKTAKTANAPKPQTAVAKSEKSERAEKSNNRKVKNTKNRTVSQPHKQTPPPSNPQSTIHGVRYVTSVQPYSHPLLLPILSACTRSVRLPYTPSAPCRP